MQREETAGPHHVVVIGAGFAGLQAVKALAGAGVRITLIDRKNHHLFQPLLYQVATTILSPSEIAWPIRHRFATATAAILRPSVGALPWCSSGGCI